MSRTVCTFWENRDFVFIIIAQFLVSANNWIRLGLQIVFVCLYITLSHYHNCVNSSEYIEHTKCPSDIFFLECVRLNIFYQLSIIKYTGLCVFSLPISLAIIEIIQIYFVILSSSNPKYDLLLIVKV